MKIDIKEKIKGLFASVKSAPMVYVRGAVSVLLVFALIFSFSLSAWMTDSGLRSSAAPEDEGSEILNYNAGMKRTAVSAITGKLNLSMISVELDLAVTVVNQSNIVVTGIPFEFKIYPENRESKAITVIDDDMDGQIYVTDLDEGTYEVELVKTAGVSEAVKASVKIEPKVSYVQKDVSKKVVSEKDINVEEEDKQYNNNSNTGAETSSPAVVNTVDYVETTSKTETKTTETPVLDSNGNQIIKYKPVVTTGADGLTYLVLANGSASTVIATLDANGYLTAAKRLDVGGDEEEPAVPQEPAVPEPTTPEPAEPTYTDVLSEVVNADGTPVSQNGVFVYQFTSVPQVTVSTETVTTYYGWQTFDGKTYYFDKNGVKVTGWQIIEGVNYYFESDGARGGGTSGNLGIDVSTWQGSNIDWNKVKASGIDFVFIRLGYRGYTAGSLVLDSQFKRNIAGATNAGLKVGVYFFTQAINEAEAVEEASMCLQYVRGYNIIYPIAIDVEYSGSSQGRANKLSVSQRTKVCIAFCETIRNAGYIPAVYANKNYFESMLYTSQLESYVIWLAHYTDKTSYSRRYDLWQYSSTGRVNGIDGNVDMNFSYLKY